MFGLSFGKLLVLAAVIVIVWVGWRKFQQASEMIVRQAKRQSAPPPDPKPGPAEDSGTIDLVRNPKTGQFEPRRRD